MRLEEPDRVVELMSAPPLDAPGLTAYRPGVPTRPLGGGNLSRWETRALGHRGLRSTIVGVPPSAVPNFAKSLIVVARRGFSDAARRSIVSRGTADIDPFAVHQPPVVD